MSSDENETQKLFKLVAIATIQKEEGGGFSWSPTEAKEICLGIMRRSAEFSIENVLEAEDHDKR